MSPFKAQAEALAAKIRTGRICYVSFEPLYAEWEYDAEALIEAFARSAQQAALREAADIADAVLLREVSDFAMNANLRVAVTQAIRAKADALAGEAGERT